jgi:4-phytase/acid phosphatase
MRIKLTSSALGILCAVGGLLVGPMAVAARERTLVVERAVLVMRHGIRAPLDGEVPPERKPFRRLTYLDCKRASALKR